MGDILGGLTETPSLDWSHYFEVDGLDKFMDDVLSVVANMMGAKTHHFLKEPSPRSQS